MSSKKRPTESTWDSDDDLLQDDLPGINAFPRTKTEEDELDEDALLGLDTDDDIGMSNEISVSASGDITLGNSKHEDPGIETDEDAEDVIDIGITADEDIDILAAEDAVSIEEQIEDEANEIVETEQLEGQFEDENGQLAVNESMSVEQFEQTDTVEELLSTSQEEENRSTNREESESDSESDDDEEKGRGRFKSERATISTVSGVKKRTDIPDTLEISEEQQHEIEQFLANRQNQKFGRRGRKGQRGGQNMGQFSSLGNHFNSGQPRHFQPVSGGLLSSPQQLIPGSQHEPPHIKTRKIHVNPHFKGPTAQVTSTVAWPSQASTAVSWTSQQNIAVTQTLQQPSRMPPPRTQIPEAWQQHSQHTVSQYNNQITNIPASEPYQASAVYPSHFQQGPPHHEIPFSQHGPPLQNYQTPIQHQITQPNSVNLSQLQHQPQQPAAGSHYPQRHLAPQIPSQPPGIVPGTRPLMQQQMRPPQSAPAGQFPFIPNPMQLPQNLPQRPFNNNPRFPTMNPQQHMHQRQQFEQHRPPQMQGAQRQLHQFEPRHLQPVQKIQQFQQQTGYQQLQQQHQPQPPPLLPLQQHHQHPQLQQPQQQQQQHHPLDHFQQFQNLNQKQLDSDMKDQSNIPNRLENKKVYPVGKKNTNVRQTNLKVLSSPSPQHTVARKRPSVNETLTSPLKIMKKDESEVQNEPVDEEGERMKRLLEEQKRKREMIQRQKEIRRQQQAEKRRQELLKKLADQGKSIDDIVGNKKSAETTVLLTPTKSSTNKPLPKGQQIQTISRQGFGTKSHLQPGHMKSTKLSAGNSEIQSKSKETQPKTEKLGMTQSNQGRGLRGSDIQASSAQTVSVQQSPRSNENILKEEKQAYQGQQSEPFGSRTHSSHVNVSHENVVKNVVLQLPNANANQNQETNKPETVVQHFTYRGHPFIGRGHNPRMTRGLNNGINRGFKNGLRMAVNWGMGPRRNQITHSGIIGSQNRTIGSVMNRGMINRGIIHRGMNPTMSRGMMNRYMDVSLTNKEMNRGSFRERVYKNFKNRGNVSARIQQKTSRSFNSNISTGQSADSMTGELGQEEPFHAVVSIPQSQIRTVIKQSPKTNTTASRTIITKQQGANLGNDQADQGNSGRHIISHKTGPTLVSIDNLSASTSEDDVRKLCRSVGEPESVAMIKSQKKAVVTFSNHADAAIFTSKYNRYMLDLSHITVRVLSS